MNDYRLMTDVTADVSETMLRDIAPVDFLPMPVRIGEVEYLHGTENGISIKEFYDMQREGCFATTAQISPNAYMEAFEPCLKRGEDILYLCFASGLSGSWTSAQLAARELQAAYPDRKLISVDTLAASVGEGLLVMEAAHLKAEGMAIEDLAAWVETHRLQVCHWFIVDGFTHLKHGGRVSSAAAAIGSVLTIKPLLHVDEAGKLVVAQKPRGMKAAMKAELQRMTEGWRPELSRRVVIGHGDCLDRAEQLGELVKESFPDAELHYAYIGPVIGAHTGPGMLALTYWGDNR